MRRQARLGESRVSRWQAAHAAAPQETSTLTYGQQSVVPTHRFLSGYPAHSRLMNMAWGSVRWRSDYSPNIVSQENLLIALELLCLAQIWILHEAVFFFLVTLHVYIFQIWNRYPHEGQGWIPPLLKVNWICPSCQVHLAVTSCWTEKAKEFVWRLILISSTGWNAHVIFATIWEKANNCVSE